MSKVNQPILFMPPKLSYKILFYISIGLILLLILYILKDFILDIFSNLEFENFPEKFSWFDISILVLGSIWTFFVFRIERKSSRNTEIQNQLAFEVNRPVLSPVENKIAIKNNGNFDAWNIQFYRITETEIKKFDDFTKVILGSGLSYSFDIKTQKVCAIVIVYQNLASIPFSLIIPPNPQQATPLATLAGTPEGGGRNVA